MCFIIVMEIIVLTLDSTFVVVDKSKINLDNTSKK